MSRSRLPKKKSRVGVARNLPGRPLEGKRKTAILWLAIGFIGIALAIAGIAAWPVLIVGAIFILVSFPMALISYRKVGG